MIDEILKSIDAIDDVTLESTMSIVDSMFKAYEKSSIILENYEGDDLSSFSIFQEGEIMDDFKKQGEGQSTFMKILSALPRLVIAVVRKLIGCFKKHDPDALNKKINDLSDGGKMIMDTMAGKNAKKEKRRQTLKSIALYLVSVGGTLLAIKGSRTVRDKVVVPHDDKIMDEFDAEYREKFNKMLDDFLAKYSGKTHDMNKKYIEIIEAYNKLYDNDKRKLYVLKPIKGDDWSDPEGVRTIAFITDTKWASQSFDSTKSRTISKMELNPNIVNMPFRILNIMDPSDGISSTIGNIVKPLDKNKKINMFLNEKDGYKGVTSDNYEKVKSTCCSMSSTIRAAIIMASEMHKSDRNANKYILTSSDIAKKFSADKLSKKSDEISKWHSSLITDVRDTLSKNVSEEPLKSYDDSALKTIRTRCNEYVKYIEGVLAILKVTTEFYNMSYATLSSMADDIQHIENECAKVYDKRNKTFAQYRTKEFANQAPQAGHPSYKQNNDEDPDKDESDEKANTKKSEKPEESTEGSTESSGSNK